MFTNFSCTFVVIAIGIVPPAIAREKSCVDFPYRDVASLSALPVSLQTMLAAGSPGGKIADAHEPYNSTDLLTPHYADQRFRSGKLGQDCAVISVERGASHRARMEITFLRNENSWTEISRTVAPSQWFRDQ